MMIAMAAIRSSTQIHDGMASVLRLFDEVARNVSCRAPSTNARSHGSPLKEGVV